MLVHVTDGRVVQLQQCCATQFGEETVIPASAWTTRASRLIGHWEITPVSECLEQILQDGIFQCRSKEIEKFTVDFVQYSDTNSSDALQCFVAPVMNPRPGIAVYVPAWNLKRSLVHRNVWRFAVRRHPHQQRQYMWRVSSPIVVVFGRQRESTRWRVVYAGFSPYDDRHPQGTARGPSEDSFSRQMSAVEGQKHSPCYCLMLGSVSTEDRQVMTLWYNKWMIFDKYGTLSPYYGIVPEPKRRARSSAAAMAGGETQQGLPSEEEGGADTR